MSEVSVLIVDGLKAFRQCIRSILLEEPVALIGEASDGFSAVQLAQQMQPSVVLIDICLPGLDGMEAGRQIRKVARNAKIVFVTQEFDPDIVQGGLQVGALGYVLKCDAARELVEAIHAVLRGEVFVSSGVARNRFLDGA